VLKKFQSIYCYHFRPNRRIFKKPSPLKKKQVLSSKRNQNNQDRNERDADKVIVNTLLEGEGGYCVLFFLFLSSLVFPLSLLTLLPIPIPHSPLLYPFFPHAKHLTEA